MLLAPTLRSPAGVLSAGDQSRNRRRHRSKRCAANDTLPPAQLALVLLGLARGAVPPMQTSALRLPGYIHTLFIPPAVGAGYAGPGQQRGNICNHQCLQVFCEPSNLIALRPKQPFAVQLALALRGLAKGAVPPLPFVGVTCIATATLLIGWRTAFAALTKVGTASAAGSARHPSLKVFAAPLCISFVSLTPTSWAWLCRC